MLRWFAGLVAVGLLGACTSSPDAAPADPEPCLGSVEYCELPLAEVGLLGAHHAASSAAAGSWVSPWTNLTLTQMLDRQVRALHLQLRSGVPYPTGVLTDPDAAPPPSPAPTLRPTLEQVRQRLLAGSAAGGPGVYVCDSWCELGAVELASVLRELDAWLVENPREIIVLLFDDFVPAPAVADVFRASPLDSRVIRGEVDGTEDTKDLLARGQVLVTHRNAESDFDWYRTDLVRASSPLPADGSAGACRAEGDQPMLALEHWVAGRPPELADAIAQNEQSVLAGRLSQCRRQVGQLPSMLMLSFVEVGDGARALTQVRNVG